MAVNNNDVLRADYVINYDNTGEMMNVFHFKLSSVGPVAEADVTDDIVGILDGLYTILRLIMTSRVIFDIIRVINKTQGTDVGLAESTLTTGAVTASEAEPQQVAATITLPTGFLGSAGRKQVFGLTEDNVSPSGILGAAALANLASAAAYMLDTYVTVNGSYVFGIDSVPQAGFVPFSAASIPTIVGTQRSRKRGVGI
jgi:hypothetical protein